MAIHNEILAKTSKYPLLTTLLSARVGDFLDSAPIQVLSLPKPLSFNSLAIFASMQFFRSVRVALDPGGKNDNVSGPHGPV
jgi:hypothetical protein